MTLRSEWLPAGEGCTCLVNPHPYTHYGIVEPGDALEPDPLCPAHFPPRWKVACINWGANSAWMAPKATVYCLVGGEAMVNRYFSAWVEAVAWLDGHRDSLEHWARFLHERATADRAEAEV